MDKNVKMSMLLELYGNMLTDTQRDTASLYYDQNLSLREIAEDDNISRQGVLRNLKLAEDKLLELEEKLGILKEKLRRNQILEEVIDEIDDKNIKDRLSELL